MMGLWIDDVATLLRHLETWRFHEKKWGTSTGSMGIDMFEPWQSGDGCDTNKLGAFNQKRWGKIGPTWISAGTKSPSNPNQFIFTKQQLWVAAISSISDWGPLSQRELDDHWTPQVNYEIVVIQQNGLTSWQFTPSWQLTIDT